MSGDEGLPIPSGPGPGAALLCESCGYVLDGLDTAARCPECGLAVAESLPGRRQGTRWQRDQSLPAWIATNTEALRRPRGLFGDAIMERRHSRRLARTNLVVSGILIGLGWTVQVLRIQFVSERHFGLAEAFGTAWFALCIVAPAAGGLMWAGTWIESLGIRFIGRRRGWRITRDVAWAVCGHASVGWTIAGLLWFAGSLVSWALGLSSISRPAPNVVVIHRTLPWLPMLAGFFAGLLVFEVLVNIGVRRCRYTNSGE